MFRALEPFLLSLSTTAAYRESAATVLSPRLALLYFILPLGVVLEDARGQLLYVDNPRRGDSIYRAAII